MRGTSSSAAVRESLAVQVWSGWEQTSARYLRERGYEVFLPCYRERRRWSDRIKVVERALFAGYRFCQMVPGVLGKVISAPGVIRMVGNDRGPLPIPTQEIEAIQRIVATQLPAEPWPVPRVAQKTRIECGLLSGVEGVVLKLKNGTG